MLTFRSASARIVNSRRAITEVLEVATDNAPQTADLVMIHASIGHDFQALAEQAQLLAPNARVVGTSCCGVVGREGVSESMKDIAVMTVNGPEFAVSSCDGIHGHNAYAKCLEMAQELKGQQPDTSIIYVLLSGIDIDNNGCLRAFEEVFGPEVTLFGATSSDNMKGHVSYQIVDAEVREHGGFAVGLADPTLAVETQATHGFVAVGEPLVVTKSTDNIIEELNGQPAWPEYLRHLGLEKPADCGDTIPIGALAEELTAEQAREYGNAHILRAVTSYGEADDTLYYATAIAPGTKLWLTKRDEDLIFSEMDRMTQDMKARMGNGKTVAVFHADCLARGRWLFGRIMKEELVSKMQHPFSDDGQCPPWIGMYGFGEYAKLGSQNAFHNYTTALCVIYRNA